MWICAGIAILGIFVYSVIAAHQKKVVFFVNKWDMLRTMLSLVLLSLSLLIVTLIQEPRNSNSAITCEIAYISGWVLPWVYLLYHGFVAFRYNGFLKGVCVFISRIIISCISWVLVLQWFTSAKRSSNDIGEVVSNLTAKAVFLAFTAGFYLWMAKLIYAGNKEINE